MSLWPLLPRRDIVGRRCVTVNCNRNDINGEPLNMGRGVIRASSHADPAAQDEKASLGVIFVQKEVIAL